MARIVITTAGTLGDFVPFIALGKRLTRRGHDVRLAVNPAMLPLVAAAGLRGVRCGPTFGPTEARGRAAVFDAWTPMADDDVRRLWPSFEMEATYHDLAGACVDADLLIASSLASAASMVHEKTGVPWVSVSLLPEEWPHADDTAFAASTEHTHLWLEWYAHVNTVRTRLGLPPLVPEPARQQRYSNDLVLLASSPEFSQPVLTDFPHARITGFWFDDDSTDWTPGDDLRHFVEPEPRPFVLTFSSLPLADPQAVVAVHAAAAMQLRRRLLVQAGWANLDATYLPASVDRSSIFFAGAIPHAWLFARAAAVIHHGGIGTSAQALRCGCPMLVEPYGNDQFFNALRVVRLGVGVAAHPHRLTVDGLVRLLGEKVLTDTVRQRASQVAARLRHEDGLQAACDEIETLLIPQPGRAADT
jgi:UDP:flavonoid glycosyltransferase YjiC (YdhE family)